MPAYDIRPLQLHILDHLRMIDKVCKEHHLRYYLVAGTMLGAIRHKGFIPWDDDLDIGMPREDYDQLMEHHKEWVPSPYEVVCAEHGEDYPGNFAKIINADTTLIERKHLNFISGTYIDVFPIDGMTSNTLMQRIHMFRHSFLHKIIYLLRRDPYKHGHGPSSWLPLLVQRLFDERNTMKRLLQLQRKYDYEKHDLVVDHDFKMRGIMPKQIYGLPTPVEFEGETFWGVAQSDEYLRRIYGNYMEIPAGEKQKQHNFHYLDYQQSYKDYLSDKHSSE